MVEGVLHGLEEGNQLGVLQLAVHKQIQLLEGIVYQLGLVHLVGGCQVRQGYRDSQVAPKLKLQAQIGLAGVGEWQEADCLEPGLCSLAKHYQ